jgi:hypothetical protein
VVVSTEAVESLLEKVQTAEEQAQAGGEIELVLSESEVTSLAVFELEKVDPQPLTDLQIFLRDGQMTLRGSYSDGDFTLPISMVTEPEVFSDGGFRLVLVSAKLGPISAPDLLMEQIQAMLDEQIAQALTGQAGEGFKVTQVTIADGFITLRGFAP